MPVTREWYVHGRQWLFDHRPDADLSRRGRASQQAPTQGACQATAASGCAISSSTACTSCAPPLTASTLPGTHRPASVAHSTGYGPLLGHLHTHLLDCTHTLQRAPSRNETSEHTRCYCMQCGGKGRFPQTDRQIGSEGPAPGHALTITAGRQGSTQWG